MSEKPKQSYSILWMFLLIILVLLLFKSYLLTSLQEDLIEEAEARKDSSEQVAEPIEDTAPDASQPQGDEPREPAS